MLNLIERHRADAQTYVSRSVALDPLVSRVARLIQESPSDFELVASLSEGISEAIKNVRRTVPTGDHTIRDHFVELRNRARLFRTLLNTLDEASNLIREGNSIVTRWDEELRPWPNSDSGVSDQ